MHDKMVNGKKIPFKNVPVNKIFAKNLLEDN